MFTNTEPLALAGFLAGHSGLTRQTYELDLRQYASWCQQHQLHLSGARRAGIEFLPAAWKRAAGPGQTGRSASLLSYGVKKRGCLLGCFQHQVVPVGKLVRLPAGGSAWSNDACRLASGGWVWLT